MRYNAGRHVGAGVAAAVLLAGGRVRIAVMAAMTIHVHRGGRAGAAVEARQALRMHGHGLADEYQRHEQPQTDPTSPHEASLSARPEAGK